MLFPLNPNIHCLRTFSKSLPRSSADVVDGNLTHIHKVREYGENCLNSMLAANPVRINYMNRYQEIINDYNSEQDQATIEKTFAELDHWTDKQETKAAVDNLIRDTLWEELPDSYDDAHIPGYKDKIYEYIYLRYGINKAA